jgi:hypothetical protein
MYNISCCATLKQVNWRPQRSFGRELTVEFLAVNFTPELSLSLNFPYIFEQYIQKYPIKASLANLNNSLK